MASVSLRLQLVGLAVYLLLRPSHQSCYPFLGDGSNIGHLKPFDFQYVEEGTTLHIECSLDSAFAASHPSLTADDIFWDNPTFQRLSPDFDSRVRISRLDNLTTVLDISNISVLDNGQYACSVMLDGKSTRLCAIEVPVAGPPKKYLDFECESQNYLNLICTWRKSGYYTGRSQMKYALKYRTSAGPNEYDCPRITSTRDGVYKCEWISSEMKNPPMMLQYKHYLTINGTNSFGSDAWTEKVTPMLLVRPAPPVNLTISAVDGNSYRLSWGIVSNLDGDFLRQIGLQTQIDIAKQTGKDEPQYHTVADGVEELHFTLMDLDAYANYSVRLRSHPKGKTGYWSNYSTVACTTRPAQPAGHLGIVPGAYEEVGNGGQRRVTLYWQGIPEHLRNGPLFRYRLVARDGAESRDLGETYYANFFIAAPANSSLQVDVIPVNEMGLGKLETAVIPAVRDSPLLIAQAHVVKFAADGQYEVSWEANRPADTFDLFWCATSLQPHLAKCTDQMSHVSVAGGRTAFNLTLGSEKEYRFAVAGRVGDLLSGMTWIARQCSSTDEHAQLEGLTVTAVANASVDLSWNSPCQGQFLRITGYRVYYYRCDVNTPKECSPDKYRDILHGTNTTVRGLQPGRRYCFLLMVLDDVNSTSPYVHKVEQCIRTTQLVPGLPLPSIVGGSVAGALFLVVIAFIVWRLIKRMRNDFNEIQKQSRIINIPPVVDKYDEAGYGNDNSTHYTKIDRDVSPGRKSPFARQLSSVSETSSSGHGSIISDGPSSSRISGSDGDTDGTFLTPHRVDIISGLTGTRVAGSLGSGRVKHRHSTFDLDHLTRTGQKSRAAKLSPDTVSLGSSESSLSGPGQPKPRLRIRIPSNVMHITAPTQKTSLALDSTSGSNSGADGTSPANSGVSDSQASSGYVAATAALQHPSLTAQDSLGATTDTGYVSQQSTMSHSLDGSETSVFSELDSPVGSSAGGRKKCLALRDSVGYSEGSYGGSEGDLTRGSGDYHNPPGGAMAKSMIVLPEQIVPGSGYVAWP